MDDMKNVVDLLPYNMAKAYTDKELTDLKKSGGVGYTNFEIIYQAKAMSLNNNDTYFSITQSPAPFVLTEGKHYKVVWNGVEYDCVAYQSENGPEIYIGNHDFAYPGYWVDGEPFFIGTYTSYDSTTVMSIYSTDAQATFSISGETVYTTNPEYMPDEFKPKVIDLDKYGIGATILGLFASGGGSTMVEGAGQICVDATTTQELRLVMAGMGFSFVIDQCTRAYLNDYVCQIAFAVMLYYNGGIYSMDVAIVRKNDVDANVHVSIK